MDNVAITGMGVISSIGLTVEAFLSNLDQGVVEIAPAPWADPENGRYAWLSRVRDFDPADWMAPRIVEGTTEFSQYALAAAMQAVEDRGEDLDPERTGVVLGNTVAGARVLLEAQHLLDTVGPHAVPKKLNLQAWPNMAAGQVALNWKLHGPLLTVSTACASSLDAIGTAARMIESGAADVVITGGTESGINAAAYYSQLAYGMSNGGASDPSRVSMPFDVDRSGLLEGEGAGVIMLERADHARDRGAKIYGYLRGYGSLSDGYHPSSPDPSGEWEAKAMERAQKDAKLPRGSEDVEAIIAHGTATPVGDAAEILAINQLFGERLDSLLVTSIKGHIGHTGSAAGVMGLIAGIHAMETGRLVHTAGTTQVEESARFKIVTGAPTPAELTTFQVNGFGFGGQNASIVVSQDLG